jgi:predicted  nucleic acid-binding Zn-ribbon protein
MGSLLSEIPKFSSNNVKGWLESETGSIFNPVHARAQTLLEEMRGAIESFSDVSKMLLDNSGKEIEKRNMKTYRRARALNKLARMFLDRIKQIKVPEQVYYDSFSDFVQETQRAFLVTEVDIKNWFPRISPFFILDRRKFLTVFEKAKELLKDMQNFLTKEYVKTKTLEETFQLADKLKNLEGQLSNLKEEKAKAESEKASIEKEITETQQKMTDLKSKGGISQLNQIAMDIETLSTEVKHSLQHLQKPFIKLQSLTVHGGGSGLTPEEVNKLDQYLEKPFEALATEQASYPLLKQILQKLGRSMTDGKLKLKPDKMRKAEQAIENVLNKNSLASLHQKCVDATMRKRQLSTSAEVAETKGDLSKLQEHLEKLGRKKSSVELEESATERACNETLEKIRNHKSQIEKNVFGFMGRKVHIE